MEPSKKGKDHDYLGDAQIVKRFNTNFPKQAGVKK